MISISRSPPVLWPGLYNQHSLEVCGYLEFSPGPLAGLSRGSKPPSSAGGKSAGIYLGQVGWLSSEGLEAAWAYQGGCRRELSKTGWGKEVVLTQPSHMVPLKSLLSRFNCTQRNQCKDTLAGWLAGGLRHMPQKDRGVSVSQSFPGSCDRWVPASPINPTFWEKLPWARSSCRVSG